MTDQPPPVVYVVCQAEYEANGPVAVFTNETAATEHAKTLRAGSHTDYEVEPMPLLDQPAFRTSLHVRRGYLNHGTGEVERETATVTEGCWNYDVPSPPTVDASRVLSPGAPGVTVIHVTGATVETVEAAFREAVEKVREAS